MALAVTRRFGEVVVAETVHPEYRQVLATFLEHLEPELVTVPAHDGQVTATRSRGRFTDQTAAVIFQYPNFLGQLEDVQAIVKAAHDRGALAIVVVRPDQRRPAQAPDRLRRRHRRGRRPVAGQSPVLTAARTWESWSAARNTCGRCRAGSSARRPTGTETAAGC